MAQHIQGDNYNYLGTIIPFTSIGESLDFVSLPGIYFLFLLFTLTAYLRVAQYVKERFIHKFGSLLWFSDSKI